MQRSRATVRAGRREGASFHGPPPPIRRPTPRPSPPLPAQALTITAVIAAAAAAVALPALVAPAQATPVAPGFRKGGARAAVHARAAEVRRDSLKLE